MPRYFVYVNTNPTKKHITIHPENTGPCSEICKHIRIGGAYSGVFRIERIRGRNTIRIEGAENSYWLVVWAAQLNRVQTHPDVAEAQRLLGVTPAFCSKC